MKLNAAEMAALATKAQGHSQDCQMRTLVAFDPSGRCPRCTAMILAAKSRQP